MTLFSFTVHKLITLFPLENKANNHFESDTLVWDDVVDNYSNMLRRKDE